MTHRKTDGLSQDLTKAKEVLGAVSKDDNYLLDQESNKAYCASAYWKLNDEYNIEDLMKDF